MFKILTKALLVRDNKILLLRRAETSSFAAGKWDIPGGKLDFGESLEESLLREIKEETSINVEVLNPICTCSNVNEENTKQYISIVYYCNYIDGEVKLNSEHDDYIWINPKDMDEKNTIYYAVKAIKRFNNSL